VTYPGPIDASTIYLSGKIVFGVWICLADCIFYLETVAPGSADPVLQEADFMQATRPFLRLPSPVYTKPERNGTKGQSSPELTANPLTIYPQTIDEVQINANTRKLSRHLTYLLSHTLATCLANVKNLRKLD
jgi:hypothetical protein